MSTGPLAQLLVVQDLDTAITQLQHKRISLAERSGLTAVQAELAGLSAQQAELAASRASRLRPR